MPYTLNQKIIIAPTDRVGGERGLVNVLGIMEFEVVPKGEWQRVISGSAEDKQLANSIWYAICYTEPGKHRAWGVTYLPEPLLADMEAAAKILPPAEADDAPKSPITLA